MRKLFLLLATCSLACAQTAQTIPFRAILSTANEVPAVTDFTASGAATIWAHVVRDASGQIVSGSVDFSVTSKFGASATITAAHIHNGNAGTNGPVVIDTGLSKSGSVTPDATGAAAFSFQAQVSSGSALDALKGLVDNPSAYYFNVHTTAYPNGVMRGQLMRADMLVLLAQMSPLNETPPITDSPASALGAVTVLATRDASGAINSAQVNFDLNYSGMNDLQITGFHIHAGSAGVAGPVTINSGLAGPLAAGSSGAGSLHFEVEANVSNSAQLSTLNGLFSDPWDYYINAHTTTAPGGLIRSQLYPTDRMKFPVIMSTANEVPPVTDTTASAPATITVYTQRKADATAAGAMVIFDANYRLPAGATITGFHIHDGAATVNGPVTINTGVGSGANSVVTDSGSGNLYRVVLVPGGAGLASVNSLIANPENQYVNLHTTTNPGGLIRSQLAPANTAKPSITSVVSAVRDPKMTTSAPLGLITISGSNLTKVAADLSAIPNLASAPTSLNGTSVTVGGKAAPIVAVDPGFIVAEVPADVPAGSANVVVQNSNGASSAQALTIATAAPALFFDTNGGVVLKNSDYSLVGAGNPAAAGDVLLVYSIGLGQTTPALATGQVAPSSPFVATSTVTATIGGQNAPVIYSIASPGFVGLYQTAITVPSGVTGRVPLVLSTGGASSNPVMINLK